MMKKHFRIPRKEHEVYFIDISEKKLLKKQKIEKEVIEQLKSLHPGFSSKTIFDIHLIYFDKKKWAMITVIEKSVLTELRILYPRYFFYTSTSVLIQFPDFIHSGIKLFSDELIGYSLEKAEPISLPSLQTKGIDFPEFRIVKEMCVFNLKKSMIQKTFFISSVILFLFLLLNGGKLAQIESDIVVLKSDTVTVEKIPIPTAFRVLDDISACVVHVNGKIKEFSYDENNIESLTLFITNCEPSQITKELESVSYLKFCRISEIRYEDNNPYFTLRYSLNLQEYRVHSNIAVSDLIESLLVIDGIKSNTQMLNRQINSVEIIKNTEGDTLLSIENTIYPYSLEEMLLSNEAYFFEKNLVVQKILLSTDDSKTLFHLQYSLINSCVEESNLGLIKNQHSYIPGAFGISILKNTETVTQKKTSKTISNTGYKKIGSINLENKTNIQYYRNFEGKIITIED